MINRRTPVASHRCGRRDDMFGGVADKAFPGPDQWMTGNWAANDEERRADIAEWMAKYPEGSIGNTQWPGPGEMPRVCSYCGGVHPDDAVRLIREGWTVAGTDKGYKRYMEPPGYRAWCRRVDECWPDRAAAGDPPAALPIPPVKVYTQHFSEEQITAFNAALADSNPETPDAR